MPHKVPPMVFVGLIGALGGVPRVSVFVEGEACKIVGVEWVFLFQNVNLFKVFKIIRP